MSIQANSFVDLVQPVHNDPLITASFLSRLTSAGGTYLENAETRKYLILPVLSILIILLIFPPQQRPGNPIERRFYLQDRPKCYQAELKTRE
jgi:hypothetical protein